ncbi:MAG: sigma-70 family RNA polymerase sigma factor, partial [Clostridia bacterium]|nr:sigma-70 family RNA polymerase sigma factor [Clostridia bacterium]
MKKTKKDITYEKIKLAQLGDDFSKTSLIEENMGLVFSIAKRFYNRGYDSDDINQLGTIGLLKAIEKFDLSQNVCFSTYAVPLILGEIKRFLRDDGPIKVSRSIKQTATQVSHFIEQQQKTLGVTPGIEDISNALGLEIDEIIKAQEATKAPESISVERDDGTWRLEDFLKSETSENEILTKIDIKSAISTLSEREKTILQCAIFWTSH